MNPFKVALLHRGQWYRWEARIDGQFAYPVPEFEWEHFNIEKEFSVDLGRFAEFDILWWDDGKYKLANFTPPKGKALRPLPVVYYVLYPTLAPYIFTTKLKLAQANADMVLLDHDDLSRWQERADKFFVRRCAYSVNERYYRDRGRVRDIDVSFLCYWGHNRERPALDAWLQGFCKRKGYAYAGTGPLGGSVGTRYAELLARSKVAVHLNRSPETRPPRIFDASACGAAVLANPMPGVSGEYWEPWQTYVPFATPCGAGENPYKESEIPRYTDADCQEVIAGLEWLLDEGHWEAVAARARQYVLTCHTWAQRAKELRGIFLDCWPNLREKAGGEALWAYRDL